jgi:hypothetical protein
MISGESMRRTVLLWSVLAALFFGFWLFARPGWSTGALAKADVALGVGDFDTARGWFETAVGTGDSRDQHHGAYKLALLAWWQGDIDRARSGLDAVIGGGFGSLLGESTALRSHLNGTWFEAPPATGLELGLTLKVLKVRTKSGDFRYADSFRVYDEEDGLAALYHGKSLLGAGRYTEALRVFDQCSTDHAWVIEGHKCRYKAAFTSYLLGQPTGAKERLTSVGRGPLQGQARAFATWLDQQ